MEPLRCLAPAKVNVCLFVGRPRRDGYHPLVSIVQPLSLADELVLERSDSGGDDVVCAGVDGENLAARALHAFRAATRWDGPPLRLDDHEARTGRGRHGRRERRRRGDAPARRRRVRPRRPGPAARAGDRARRRRPEPAHARALPDDGDRRARPPARRPEARSASSSCRRPHRLSTPAGLRRVRPPRPRPRRRRARPPERPGPGRRASRPRCSPSACCTTTSRRPPARSAPRSATRSPSVRSAGAVRAMVSGSGPTVVGLFTGEDGPAHARAAAATLAERHPGAIAAEPVGRAYADPQAV